MQILRDQMTWRRLRVGCGLVMFSYLALHLCMHALGNVSFAAMQWATHLHDAIWHSAPGTLLLYGAFAIHFCLALYALYARRSFRMGWGELTRLALGFSIVPLMVHHFAAGRYVWSAFDIDRRYDIVLPAYFVTTPLYGWVQVTALLVAWTHGCLGIHFWLRERPGYARYVPALLAIAVLLPTLALLGLYQGTRETMAKAAPAAASSDYGGYGDYGDYGGGQGKAAADEIRTRTKTLEQRTYWAYVLLVAAVFAARGVRSMAERRRGVIAITYPGGRIVHVPVGYPVLEASREARIPHASICGGRGRCTTCRVRVLRGGDTLPPPQASERSALARLRAGPNVRLACQLRPTGDVAVLPLLPAHVSADDPARNRDAGSMERFVAIMFVDIRRSTALFERRLPFDVIFLLNHFFDAVAGAVTNAGGAPNQFVGDGVMAIFGTRTGPKQACAQAIAAAKLIRERLDDMNRTLENELADPIAIGIGVHAGNAILGEIGYGDRFILTAIGDTVHVAARLQDLTKEYKCEVIVSDAVLTTSGMKVATAGEHDVQVRGRDAPVRIHVVAAAQPAAA